MCYGCVKGVVEGGLGVGVVEGMSWDRTVE